MPTTEIVSIGATSGPFTVKKSVFAQRCDSRLISDRGLFQPTLDRLVGTIIHLGDFSDTPDEPCWFCGHCVKYREGDDEGYHIGYAPEAESELIDVCQIGACDQGRIDSEGFVSSALSPKFRPCKWKLASRAGVSSTTSARLGTRKTTNFGSEPVSSQSRKP